MTLRRQVSLGLLLFPSEFHYRAKKIKFQDIFVRIEYSNISLIREDKWISLLVGKNFTNCESGGITRRQNASQCR